jgi:hypothetical protein
MLTAAMSHKRTVALIGTSHTFQRPGHATESEFRKFIGDACAKLKVRAIAEEMSLEALAQQNASESICEQIAKARGWLHRYCDPNDEQRRALNLRGRTCIELQGFYGGSTRQQIEQALAADHAIRERYWLEQLFQLDSWPALFVCGADHIDSFCSMLKNKGVEVNVVVRDWPSG